MMMQFNNLNNQSKFNMGRGKAWFQEADLHLCQAWVQSTAGLPQVGTTTASRSLYFSETVHFVSVFTVENTVYFYTET